MDSYFIRVDKPNIDKKIIDSSIGVKHGDKHMIIDCPLSTNKPPEFESIEDRLEHLLFRIFNYTSKYVAVDELTGEAFHESELYTSYLRGRNAISDHICSGSVIYHDKNQHMLLWLEILFWNTYNVIPSDFHNLKNIDVQIKRSNGNIETGKILEPSIRISKSTNEYIIQVFVLDEDGDYGKYKHITLPQLSEFNPELSFILTFPKIDLDEFPEWVKNNYSSWKEKIYKNLNWNLKRIVLK